MEVSKELIAAGEPIWERFCDHPFLTGIGDGTLDTAKFQFYMVQDYLYLFDYARLFALGAAKAARPEDMRCFADYTQQILNGEMDTHRDYMARLGISLAEAERAELAPENRAYVSDMLACGWAGGADVIAVTIFACALSYEYLGKRLLARYPDAAAHPFFGEWVGSYTSAEYAESNRAICALVDRLTAESGPARRAEYVALLERFSWHEGRFWDMAWRGTC